MYKLEILESAASDMKSLDDAVIKAVFKALHDLQADPVKLSRNTVAPPERPGFLIYTSYPEIDGRKHYVAIYFHYSDDDSHTILVKMIGHTKYADSSALRS